MIKTLLLKNIIIEIISKMDYKRSNLFSRAKINNDEKIEKKGKIEKKDKIIPKKAIKTTYYCLILIW